MGGIQRSIPHFWQGKHSGEIYDFLVNFATGKYPVQEKLDGIAISLHWNAEMQDWWVIRSKKHLKELAPSQCLKRLWAYEKGTPKENRTFLVRDTKLTDLLLAWCVDFVKWVGFDMFNQSLLTQDVTLHFEMLDHDYRVFTNYKYNQFVYLGNIGLSDFGSLLVQDLIRLHGKMIPLRVAEIMPGYDFGKKYATMLTKSLFDCKGFSEDDTYQSGRENMEASGLDTLLEYTKVLYLHKYSDSFIQKDDPATIVPLFSGYEGLIVHTPEGKVKITGEFTPKFMEIRENLWQLRGRN